MTKFRTALLALTVTLTLAGGLGAAGPVDAKAPLGKSSLIKTTNVRGGEGWCC